MTNNHALLCLEKFKNRLTNGAIQVQRENGYVDMETFQFNPPANKNEIEKFFSDRNWSLPSDYKNLLLMHNGLVLFKHPKYKGGMEILGLHNIDVFLKDHEYLFPNGHYPIGYYNTAFLYVNSYYVELKKNYLFWRDCNSPKAMELNMNFGTWLDLFIVSQGSEFWLWPMFKEKLLRLR